MSTIAVKDSKFASYATLLLRIGIGVVSCRLLAIDSVCGERLGDRISSGGNFSRFLDYSYTVQFSNQRRGSAYSEAGHAVESYVVQMASLDMSRTSKPASIFNGLCGGAYGG